LLGMRVLLPWLLLGWSLLLWPGLRRRMLLSSRSLLLGCRSFLRSRLMLRWCRLVLRYRLLLYRSLLLLDLSFLLRSRLMLRWCRLVLRYRPLLYRSLLLLDLSFLLRSRSLLLQCRSFLLQCWLMLRRGPLLRHRLYLLYRPHRRSRSLLGSVAQLLRWALRLSLPHLFRGRLHGWPRLRNLLGSPRPQYRPFSLTRL
jgi:hypothetical protein